MWSAAELLGRRTRVITRVREALMDGGPLLLVLRAALPTYISNTPIPTRQCTYFRWLSGITMNNCYLLIDSPRGAEHSTILFFTRRSKQEEIWDGMQPEDGALMETHALDKVAPLSVLSETLDRWSRSKTILANIDDVRQHASILAQGRLNPLFSHIDEERLIKSVAERDATRRAASVGARAMQATMLGERPPVFECQLSARLLLELRRRGGNDWAYPPVVAGGERACVIHYLENNQPIQPGQCVLIDSGAEVDGYLSDITRCWPVSGRFSPQQRVVYDLLHNVHTTLVELAEDEKDISLNALHEAMVEAMAIGVSESGILKGPLEGNQLRRAVSELCPHHVGHYLGMDVHDTPTISRSRLLQDGMCFTIEPGLYITGRNDYVKAEFAGIGFRIEDDMLKTNEGVEKMTGQCVACPTQIEYLLNC